MVPSGGPVQHGAYSKCYQAMEEHRIVQQRNQPAHQTEREQRAKQLRLESKRRRIQFEKQKSEREEKAHAATQKALETRRDRIREHTGGFKKAVSMQRKKIAEVKKQKEAEQLQSWADHLEQEQREEQRKQEELIEQRHIHDHYHSQHQVQDLTPAVYDEDVFSKALKTVRGHHHQQQQNNNQHTSNTIANYNNHHEGSVQNTTTAHQNTTAAKNPIDTDGYDSNHLNHHLQFERAVETAYQQPQYQNESHADGDVTVVLLPCENTMNDGSGPVFEEDLDHDQMVGQTEIQRRTSISSIDSLDDTPIVVPPSPPPARDSMEPTATSIASARKKRQSDELDEFEELEIEQEKQEREDRQHDQAQYGAHKAIDQPWSSTKWSLAPSPTPQDDDDANLESTATTQRQRNHSGSSNKSHSETDGKVSPDEIYTNSNNTKLQQWKSEALESNVEHIKRKSQPLQSSVKHAGRPPSHRRMTSLDRNPQKQHSVRQSTPRHHPLNDTNELQSSEQPHHPPQPRPRPPHNRASSARSTRSMTHGPRKYVIDDTQTSRHKSASSTMQRLNSHTEDKTTKFRRPVPPTSATRRPQPPQTKRSLIPQKPAQNDPSHTTAPRQSLHNLDQPQQQQLKQQHHHHPQQQQQQRQQHSRSRSQLNANDNHGGNEIEINSKPIGYNIKSGCTPTDDEINTLWDAVRNGLQSHHTDITNSYSQLPDERCNTENHIDRDRLLHSRTGRSSRVEADSALARTMETSRLHSSGLGSQHPNGLSKHKGTQRNQEDKPKIDPVQQEEELLKSLANIDSELEKKGASSASVFSRSGKRSRRDSVSSTASSSRRRPGPRTKEVDVALRRQVQDAVTAIAAMNAANP